MLRYCAVPVVAQICFALSPPDNIKFLRQYACCFAMEDESLPPNNFEIPPPFDTPQSLGNTSLSTITITPEPKGTTKKQRKRRPPSRRRLLATRFRKAKNRTRKGRKAVDSSDDEWYPEGKKQQSKEGEDDGSKDGKGKKRIRKGRKAVDSSDDKWDLQQQGKEGEDDGSKDDGSKDDDVGNEEEDERESSPVATGRGLGTGKQKRVVRHSLKEVGPDVEKRAKQIIKLNLKTTQLDAYRHRGGIAGSHEEIVNKYLSKDLDDGTACLIWYAFVQSVDGVDYEQRLAQIILDELGLMDDPDIARLNSLPSKGGPKHKGPVRKMISLAKKEQLQNLNLRSHKTNGYKMYRTRGRAAMALEKQGGVPAMRPPGRIQWYNLENVQGFPLSHRCEEDLIGERKPPSNHSTKRERDLAMRLHATQCDMKVSLSLLCFFGCFFLRRCLMFLLLIPFEAFTK